MIKKHTKMTLPGTGRPVEQNPVKQNPRLHGSRKRGSTGTGAVSCPYRGTSSKLSTLNPKPSTVTGAVSCPYSILIIMFLALLCTANQLYAMVDSQWNIIDFSEHGTRRLVVVEDNRWFFYRPEPDSELTVDISEGKVMIKTAVRQDVEDLSFQIRIGNAFRNFNVGKVGTSGDFSIMEDVYLNLGPGTHTVNITSPNRLAYFKVFKEEDVWVVPTVRRAFTPARYERQYTLVSDDTESLYYSSTDTRPIEFTSTGPNDILGFARYFTNDTDQPGSFDIYVNNRLLETLSIPSRTTGSYNLKEKPDQELSIGRRIELELPAGEHRVRVVPRTEDTYIFRFIMDIPEEIPETVVPVYELNAFEELSFARKALTGLQLTFGLSFRYADNVFSLAHYDRNRFDDGNPRFGFISTADDFITNPSFRARYFFDFGSLTVEPYISANYYLYLENSNKTNYSILTGLFNSYKGFNLNLYYGYYADTYIRDYYVITGEPDTDRRFEYDRNFYRLYSYFNLTNSGTILLDYRLEEYYHNEYFTGYDGTANTYGIGWRSSFPTFYLRAFFYYKELQGDNITADIDPSYESNIYDLQFRNKRVNLSNYQFRPYMGVRMESRYFSKAYAEPNAVSSSDYQASREDKRYTLNLGCEFYLSDNFDLILDYTYFLRDSSSHNPNVARDKDYNQQSIRLGFEYSFNF